MKVKSKIEEGADQKASTSQLFDQKATCSKLDYQNISFSQLPPSNSCSTMPSNDLPTPGSLLLVQEGEAETEIRLSPIPSNDVNDPLRWSWKRKQLAHLCLFVYTLCTGSACTLVYSILIPIEKDTGIPLSTLNAGTGYFFLLLGWGGLFSQPMALMFGKRGVYLVSMIGSIACLAWNAYVSSKGEWIANKIIQGLFISPIEMLVETSIGDIFYAHERGFYIGIYAFVLFGSNYFAPLIAGFMYEAHGYKIVFFMGIMIQAVGLIFCFIFMEETNFNRNITELHEAHDDDVNIPSEVVSNRASMDEKGSEANQTEEKCKPVVATLYKANKTTTTLHGTPLGFMEKIKFFNKKYTKMSQLIVLFYRPIWLLRFPVIFWSGFQYGAFLVWYNVLNATASLILSSPPYNFKASMVGLSYAGPLIGVSFAAFYSGWFGNKFLLWKAKKSGGVREPEHRLWLLLICCLFVPSSLILWGVGAAHQIHWIGLVIGGSLLACSSAIGGAISINYALDSYKDLSGEVMLSIILVRNSLSFGIGYAITPWLNLGLQNTFISAAFVGLAITITFIPMLYFGKRFRHFSRKSYWKYVETSTLTH